MRWETGRAIIDQMLADRELQKVNPSRDHADRLLDEAERHLLSAEALAETDPEGSYQLLYDGARKSLVAILANEGLRPTSTGGHTAVFRAVFAQLEPPMGKELRPFDRMRRQRNAVEYPATDATPILPQDVMDELPKARDILNVARKVFDSMSPY